MLSGLVGANLAVALQLDDWTARLFSQLAHQQSKPLRARRHWLRTHACHREDDEPVNSFKRICKLLSVGPLRRAFGLCDHSQQQFRDPRADWHFQSPLELSAVQKHEPKRRSGAALPAVLYWREGKNSAGCLSTAECIRSSALCLIF